MSYILGLDIGIASIGWSLLSINEEGQQYGIMDLGVRTFEPLENSKDGSREARGSRRRLRRRSHRIERTKELINKYFGDEFVQNIPNEMFIDVYDLRKKALDAIVSNEEISVILLNIIKRRGFKSNRKSELKDKKSDAGLLLKATKNNKDYRISKGYRTIGEMIYLDDKYHKVFNKNGKDIRVYNVRNKEGNYINSFLRDELIEEINMIFDRQKELGNNNLDQLREDYLDIFTSQRAFDEGPGGDSPYRKSLAFNVGMCTHFPEEFRAPKASYTFEYCNLLQKVNNLKLVSNKATDLTEEQRTILINYALNSKNLTYKQVRKKLKIDDDIRFNMLNYSTKKSIDDIEKASCNRCNCYSCRYGK